MWTIFKVFIELLTIWFPFIMSFFFGWEACSILAPSPGSCTPCVGRQSLNRWTAREVPMVTFLTWFSSSGVLPGFPPVVPSLFLDNLVPEAYIFFFHKQLTQHPPSLPPWTRGLNLGCMRLLAAVFKLCGFSGVDPPVTRMPLWERPSLMWTGASLLAFILVFNCHCDWTLKTMKYFICKDVTPSHLNPTGKHSGWD